LADAANRDEVSSARAILLEGGIQNGAGWTREHEIALLDAGREELAGIFAGHPVRVDRITTTFSILDYSDVRRGQEGLEVESLLPDFGVPTHCFINNSGENTQWNFWHGKSCFLAGYSWREIVDKPAFAILALAVVAYRHLIYSDGLANT
jgi:hypothetical protein